MYLLYSNILLVVRQPTFYAKTCQLANDYHTYLNVQHYSLMHPVIDVCVCVRARARFVLVSYKPILFRIFRLIVQ